MRSNLNPPSMPSKGVLLLAFFGVYLEALKTTSELLTEFGVVTAQRVLASDSGQIPDFAEIAAEVARDEVQVVIVASLDTRSVRALAVAVHVPVIRVPVAMDVTPAAGQAALMPSADLEASAAAGAGAFATVALGEAGAKNAALLAVAILSLHDERLRIAWQAFREEQTNAVLAQALPGE